jgi:hypothetical protein
MAPLATLLLNDKLGECLFFGNLLGTTHVDDGGAGGSKESKEQDEG